VTRPGIDPGTFRLIAQRLNPRPHEVTGDYRKLPSEEFHDYALLTKYYSGDHITKNGLVNWNVPKGKMRGTQRVVVGKPEFKRPPGKPRRRWEDNIKIILKKSFGMA
jgi:hypothetical protein